MRTKIKTHTCTYVCFLMTICKVKWNYTVVMAYTEVHFN